ncbi:hypothetical protein MY5147_002521 [Beauveria neobassiana]|uniref:CMP/dCMP-type deaminase domain-containing protein n=1 Tax=Beauveria bassiana TaxID=176275 RepID=A0A2S7YLR6_BEABA|nr:hypothetical protein BB8028_0007g03250 [Beauveria bassiana]
MNGVDMDQDFEHNASVADVPASQFTAGVLPNPLIDDIKSLQHKNGVLIPLKTTQEVRQDHTIIQAFITRVPSKSAADVLTALRLMRPSGSANPLPHLRGCAKPADLPAHLKTKFMNETPEGRHVHFAKSQWLYIMCCEVLDITEEELALTLASVESLAGLEIWISTVPVPLVAPTSQIQAAMWSSQFWPTVYRKNNPLGPHPSMVARGTDEIKDDAAMWMTLAQRVADEARGCGMGEAIGAVVVQRDENGAQLVAVAGDARWRQDPLLGDVGNPMAHCVLRVISMVAQKLVRHERRAMGLTLDLPILEFDAFHDVPILDAEKKCFEQEHPNKDGYLCHGLELYMTHEPCVACSMAILHARMGKVVFCNHMPRTGGLSSDDRPDGGGRGLGLFWRRELNWSLLAWELEQDANFDLVTLDPTTHV